MILVLFAPLLAFTPIAFNDTVKLTRFVYKGEPRQYNVLFPADSDYDVLRPAILMLHGNTASAEMLLQETNMTQFAPRAGFFLVMPDGVPTPGATMRSRSRSWNAGTCCDEAFLNNVDDVAFLDAVLDDLLDRFPVDPKGVFISGTSNGGAMALRAACSLADRLAGVGLDCASFEAFDGMTCATECADHDDDGYTYCAWDQSKPGCARDQFGVGLPDNFECDALSRTPLPVLIANGNLDPVANVSDGGITYPTNPTMPGGFNTSFPPIDYITSYLLRTSGCDPSAASSMVSFHNGSAGNATVCRTWPGCETNVTLCLSDAGHKWFGADLDISEICAVVEWNDNSTPCNTTALLGDFGPDTYSMSLTNQMLSFFARTFGTR